MSLVGHQITESEKIRQLVTQIVGDVGRLNEQITGVRPADPSFADRNKKMLEQIAVLRGRPLHYPFIGSGAGRGPYVELEDGSVKLDLINGIGIHLFGHSHPRVIGAALRGALSDIIVQGNLEPNREYIQFSEKLSKLAGRRSRLKHVWFATCGTMANENALKMARQKHSPARKIVAFKNAFAGRSTMMAEVTDNPAFKQGLPEYHEVLRIPFYDKKTPGSAEKTLAAFKEHVAGNEGDIACLAFEPMLGEGGYNAAPREFFVPMLEFAKEKKIAVWIDEVQTFCRTGELFAFETLDIGQYADLVTIAKTAQLGATLYTEEYNPKPGLIAGTFSGSTVSMTTGMEMIDMMVNDGYLGGEGRVARIHKRFIDGFNRLNETTCKGKVQDAGGMGLMIAFTPHDGAKEQADVFMKKLYHNGVIAFGCGKGPFRVRFLIPACIEDQDIDVALSIIEKTIQEGY
ncbi:MAG: aminotransferase class III-fold pyridoxal phosphate-dependent enzyme [Bdellovibrionaceae bacterium]|nr:aminotransferase class III-fold pyridoxal phosphate-dependent enzyme [Pseudobdellovibrionaceae bacterium]MBX3034132.1 aminotransferase class III-fold pyridoxal phosphate-dependent enzyme [Pseudobdellovibrionaceae bacterium]